MLKLKIRDFRYKRTGPTYKYKSLAIKKKIAWFPNFLGMTIYRGEDSLEEESTTSDSSNNYVYYIG